MTNFEIPVRGKWEKTTIRHMTGEIDAYRCSLCGGVCQWKHKICPICKGTMDTDDGDNMDDMRKLPYADIPKPLTITMELSSADILVLEEISGEKIETKEQAIHALKLAMIHAD